jgi:hypothetical protein
MLTNVLDAIHSQYDTISTQLSDYVTEMYNGLSEGYIECSEIYSARDIYQEFGTSSDQSRLAAQLMAVGGDIPDQIGYQAKISHADLSSDSLWVSLYPQFGGGDPVDIAPGVTLEASEYELAYIGYESEVDSGYETRVLSGESPLEILDVTGLDGETTDETDAASGSTGTGGSFDLNFGGDPPDPIATPGDYKGYVIRVETTDGTTDTVPVAAPTDNGDGTYTVAAEDSDLPENTDISSAEIVPGTSHSQPVEHVDDPTNVDTDAQQALLDEQRETVDELKEALDNDGGGIALPSLGGIGEEVMLLVGGGIAVLAGINFATN